MSRPARTPPLPPGSSGSGSLECEYAERGTHKRLAGLAFGQRTASPEPVQLEAALVTNVADVEGLLAERRGKPQRPTSQGVVRLGYYRQRDINPAFFVIRDGAI